MRAGRGRERADAVYFGLERFNARMRAKNFTVADLPKLMAYLHRRGVRGYVTFNTLASRTNSPRPRSICAASLPPVPMRPSFRTWASAGSSAPSRPISHPLLDADDDHEFGRRRLRPGTRSRSGRARPENSLKEIAAIQAAQTAAMPLEVFVHGALCVAYSGQCLTSEALAAAPPTAENARKPAHALRIARRRPAS